MKKFSVLRLTRYLSQILFFIFYSALFVLAFIAVKLIFLMILQGNFSITKLATFITPLLIVLILDVLLGRFFCGWLCAFGTLNDALYLISKKVFKIKFKLNPKIDGTLKYAKYIIILIITLIWTLKLPYFEGTNPWDAFAQFGQSFEDIATSPIAYTLLFLICIGALFIERFFCRYLCPLGAIQAIVSRISFIKIVKPTKDCGKCTLCTKSCPMGISLYKMESASSSECIRCLSCIEVCPRKNPKFAITGTSYVLLAFIIFMVIYSSSKVFQTNGTGINKGSNLLDPNQQTVEVTDPATSPIDESANSRKPSTSVATTTLIPGASPSKGITSTPTSKITIPPTQSSQKPTVQPTVKPVPTTTNKLYKDGVYTGVARGYQSGLTVSVTVKSDKITSVIITAHHESPGFYETPFSVIPKAIISSQSTNVDGVTGATKTSNGIKNAVLDALSKAKI